MQSINSSSTPTQQTTSTPETTRVLVTADTLQEPYVFFQAGTPYSDIDAHLQGLSDRRSDDKARLQHFASLRDLAAEGNQDKFALMIEENRGPAEQWSYQFLLNKNAIFTSEQQRIGNGIDLAAFKIEQLRQNFENPHDFEIIREALQGFQAGTRETSDQVEILKAFLEFKNLTPQSHANKIDIHIEQLSETSGREGMNGNGDATYRFDIRADRGVTTIFRSAPCEITESLEVYANYFGMYKQLTEELTKRGLVVRFSETDMKEVEETMLKINEELNMIRTQVFDLDLISSSDRDMFRARGLEVISNFSIPLGIDVSINFIDEDSFQLKMAGNVLHEGRFSLMQYPTWARFHVTDSAISIAANKIKEAYRKIAENFSAYKLCGADGVELNGPTLQQAMQDQDDEIIKIEAHRITSPALNSQGAFYNLIAHTKNGGEPRSFSITEFGDMSDSPANPSECLNLLRALCVDARDQIYHRSMLFMDIESTSGTAGIMERIIFDGPTSFNFLEGMDIPIQPFFPTIIGTESLSFSPGAA